MTESASTEPDSDQGMQQALDDAQEAGRRAARERAGLEPPENQEIRLEDI